MRLIDANAFIVDIETEIVELWLNGLKGTPQPRDQLYDIINRIDEQPTVDAVPVVHGHWHIDDYDGGEPDGYAAFIEVHCSKCGYELGAESGQYGWAYGDPFPLNYCPNCGAKMDGGADNEID